MRTDDETLKRVRSLLDELYELEVAFDILGNYDAKAYSNFITWHNNNIKRKKEVFITMSPKILEQVKEELALRIKEIKEELEKAWP